MTPLNFYRGYSAAARSDTLATDFGPSCARFVSHFMAASATFSVEGWLGSSAWPSRHLSDVPRTSLGLTLGVAQYQSMSTQNLRQPRFFYTSQAPDRAADRTRIWSLHH